MKKIPVSLKKISLATVLAFSFSSVALAKTEIQWWHAMGGVNGERVDKIAKDFNATQKEFEVVPVNKGNYTETMTAAVAAFRAKNSHTSCKYLRLVLRP